MGEHATGFGGRELVGGVAAKGLLGTISTQSASSSSAGDGWPPAKHASTDACGGKLPLNQAVSMTTPRILPGRPSRTSAQSCPGPRRRAVSQPSYSCPFGPNVSALKAGAHGLRRFSFAANDSSLAAITDPPRVRTARSGNSVKSVMALPVG